MGIYDYVMGMQVKATPDPSMHNYKIGDEIPLPNGAYLCFEGVFIVKQGKVAASSELTFDKWGGQVNMYDLLNAKNPVTQALHQLDKNLKKEIRGFDEELKKK